ncbi:MAG: Ubiquinone/menaquinone biosynthesis C-methyltransferase UbiE [Acidimicrobiales bacterium]|nr:MAG: class I SAM-dependent methyltransferase [Actinomycetota bacterium]MBV6510470.1 Ubiquinone/menaquinone biosynthesis C-methyltransferase UbiE [Acidimicrobiales bacterium]RIK02482.1 MAG: methyltransferase type 11 [Acidobacteriota bacterium]
MDSSQVKAFFDEVSVEWDEMRSSFYNEAVIDALALHTEADPFMTVLDVGTGTGFVAAGLAPGVAQVVGVDNSLEMLAVAETNLAELGVGNATLAGGATDALPFADGNVDAAVANMVLHHAPEPVAMLAEMARVTRPGGWVAITDEIEHTYEWMRIEQADIWLGFSEADVAGFFADARLVEFGYASLGMQ